MPNLAIGMTTAHRTQLYAFESLASLRRAGFSETLHIFAEPNAPDLSGHADVRVHQNTTRLNCYGNWRHALEHLYEHVPADLYLIVQDDVIYRNDAAKQLTAAVSELDLRKVGFLSLYCSVAMASPDKRMGWQDAKFYNNAFWGALTLGIPRESAGRLLENGRFRGHDHHRKVDVLVGNCFRDMGLARKVHVPSLANHIGRISTLGRHKVRGISWGRVGYQFKETSDG